MCKKDFKDKPSAKRVYCSVRCKVNSEQGKKWAVYLGSHFRDKNKGSLGQKYGAEVRLRMSLAHKGKKLSKEHCENIGKSLKGKYDEDKAPNWKGDNVGYIALHDWIEKQLGKPRKCEACGRTDRKKYEWANKEHTYKRNTKDWYRFCTKCHHLYDRNMIWRQSFFLSQA